MKYICINPFPNPQGNPITIADLKDGAGKVTRKQSQVANPAGGVYKQHIHKGAVFDIGTATKFKDLSPAEKTLVSQLMVAKKIDEATDETVKAVDAEVAADQAREERDRARDLRADPMAVIGAAIEKQNEVIAGLTAAVKALTPAPATK